MQKERKSHRSPFTINNSVFERGAVEALAAEMHLWAEQCRNGRGQTLFGEN